MSRELFTRPVFNVNTISKMIIVIICCCTQALGQGTKYTCDSEIYCYGDLLHTVQMSNMYSDSKTFVDMKMLRAPQEILEDFNKLLVESNYTMKKKHIYKFVNQNFSPADEMIEWIPEDYTPNPKFINQVKNLEVRKFAKVIIKTWPKLTRKMNPEIYQEPDRYSVIPLPNGFVVPGGRFRECYYWDTYWIIKGLIASEMYQTVKGILNNFVFLIKTYGFIPTGNRLYYTRRSQPPLFVSMVWQYYKAVGDNRWLRDNIDYLEIELKYWISNSTIQVGKYLMARYWPVSEGPRPESYKEDVELSALIPAKDRQRFFIDIKGAAESGWDFSSRWFYGDKFPMGHLSETYTQRSIPVDLNSFLCKAFKDLSILYNIMGNKEKSLFWNQQANTMQMAIKEVLWNEKDGVWYDFDYIAKKHRRAFFVSNLTPLWAKIEHSHTAFERVYTYLESNRIFDHVGGTPSTLSETSQQWDYPNAWAPLQDIIIKSLWRSELQKCKNMATFLATKWINAMMIGYNETGEMFEKYNSESPGLYGEGGEYVVQAGFGWTNGVVLDLIKTFYYKN